MERECGKPSITNDFVSEFRERLRRWHHHRYSVGHGESLREAMEVNPDVIDEDNIRKETVVIVGQ